MTLEELDQLLFERAEVRRLLADRRHCRRLADAAGAHAKDNEIEGLVLRPLTLTNREKPSAWGIYSEVAQVFCDSPDRSWETAVASSSVERWPQVLKDRILTLCGSLDTILLRIRSKEQSVAA